MVLVSLANHCPWVKGMDAGLVQLVDQLKEKDVEQPVLELLAR